MDTEFEAMTKENLAEALREFYPSAPQKNVNQKARCTPNKHS